ncbi:MAG: FG-GAP-like repeat-containing protein [Bacteroidota bacterium]
MGRNIFLTISSILLLQPLFAQQYLFSPNKFGANLFAGGIDTPRFQFVDIDGDHDNDLFLLDRDEQLWFYRNINGKLFMEPKSSFGLAVGSWFRFADIDADGDQDCFTNGTSSEISLFTNVGNAASPQFQLTSAALQDTSGIDLFSERFSIPTLADPDGDGDLDLFSGSSIGSVTYYRNIGTKFSPQFTYITSAYQGINIQGGPSILPKVMHGASGIEFFDVDSNGVLDLFWGDYFNPSLYFLKNMGSGQVPNIVLSDSTYPNEDVILSYGFNVPQHIDRDGNGTVDLMIGSVFPNADHDNFMFYSNIGTNKEPFYQRQSKNVIPMIDVGSRSSIAAADLDGDGDLDLCVSSSSGTVNIFQNNGTKNVPVFSSEPTSSFTIAGTFNITVTAGDLNGDSHPDLLLGTFDHGLKVYVNSTTDGVISFVRQNHPLDTLQLGQNTSPCLVDIDKDGKLDVLVGNSGGQLAFIKNISINNIVSYSVEKNFNLIDVGNDANPFCADLDNDGVLDLIIGNIDGVLWYYKQSPQSVFKFDPVNQKYDGIDVRLEASPEAADIDGDGDHDLLIGNGKGGIFLYEKTGALSEHSDVIQPVKFDVANNYPNPFNPSTTISYTLPAVSEVKIAIYDVVGRELSILTNGTQDVGRHSIVWDASTYPSGTYFYRISVSHSGTTFNSIHSMLLIK